MMPCWRSRTSSMPSGSLAFWVSDLHGTDSHSIPLVVHRMDVAGDRRAVDADEQPHVRALFGPSLDDEGNSGALQPSAECRVCARRAIGLIEEWIGADGA